MRLTLGDLRQIIKEELNRLTENPEQEDPKLRKAFSYLNWKVKGGLDSAERAALVDGVCPPNWDERYFMDFTPEDFEAVLAKYSRKRMAPAPSDGGLRLP